MVGWSKQIVNFLYEIHLKLSKRGGSGINVTKKFIDKPENILEDERGN